MALFRKEIARLLKERGVNPSQYSRMLGYATSGLVYNVLINGKALPLEDLEKWLGAVGINQGTPEFRRLRRLAYEDYAPPHMLRLINQMTFEVGAFVKLTAQALQAHGITPPPMPDLWGDEAPAPARPSPSPAKKPSRPTTRPRRQR